MVIPQEIKGLIQGVLAAQAYEIIKALGNPRVQVFSSGLLVNITEAIEDCRSMPAKDIGPFLFWGGPPDRLRYYQGTLYTLLCDRILDVINNHGCQAARECICIPQREKVKIWL